jgi:hypothetical protein
VVEQPSPLLSRQSSYFHTAPHALRHTISRTEEKKKDKTKKWVSATLFVAAEYPEWQREVLEMMKKEYEANGSSSRLPFLFCFSFVSFRFVSLLSLLFYSFFFFSSFFRSSALVLFVQSLFLTI